MALALGCVLGFIVLSALLARGLDWPPFAALAVATPMAIVAREKDLMRGLIAGTAAIWIAAITETAHASGIVFGLVHYSETLTAARLASLAAAAPIAIFIGSRALRHEEGE